MKAKLTTLAFVLGAAGLMASTAHAQDKVKIGFITDMSSLYADVEGKNGGVAIQVMSAPIMNSAPCAKLITLSSPKMTARPKLRMA